MEPEEFKREYIAEFPATQWVGVVYHRDGTKSVYGPYESRDRIKTMLIGFNYGLTRCKTEILTYEKYLETTGG